MVILHNIVDTYAKESAPSTPYAKSTALGLRSGDDMWSYLKSSSALGMPSTATVTRVYAVVTNRDTWSGSHTLTAKRITATWDVSKLKWSKKPAATATGAVSVTKVGAVAGTEWLFDITSLVAADVVAGKFYGIRIETDNASARYLNSASAKTGKPTFEFLWAIPPAIPTVLNPTSGKAVSLARPTFQFDYKDSSAAEVMAFYQLQLKYGSDDFTTPSIDSTKTASAAPEHTFTADLTLDTPFSWRAKVWSSSGEDSDWSEPAWSVRTAKGVLTITEPGPTPDDFVQELTPSKFWTFTGTQTAFRVIDTDSVTTSKVYADSLRQVGDDGDYTSPVTQKFTGGLARTVIRVNDDVDRATTPGDPSYVEAVRVFGFQYTEGVDPVTDVRAASGTTPAVQVSFRRSTPPDSFSFERSDGRMFPNVDPADIYAGDDLYVWLDPTAPPRTPLSWKVVAVVAGESSADSPSAACETTSQYIWLLDPDDPTWWLPIADQDPGTWDMGEQSTMTEIVGSDRLILSWSAHRGYEGSVSGALYSQLPGVDNLTGQELRDRVWYLKRNPVKTYRLILSDMNIPVVVRKVVPPPLPGEELEFGFGCEFYQQGELPWEA